MSDYMTNTRLWTVSKASSVYRDSKGRMRYKIAAYFTNGKDALRWANKQNQIHIWVITNPADRREDVST